MALIFKEVFISLFAGVWLGAFIANGMYLGLLFQSFVNVIDKYLLQAMTDTGHLSVIIFSLLIGGMVGIISKNGGMRGVINKLSVFANSARNTQLVTWLMGILIFFDDYANTLIVGTTMRKISDRFRISREKLAYIVDSTAAPIAAIAFITTWIGAELGYIEDAIQQLGLDASAYGLFFQSLAYSYYPILAIAFIFILVTMQRDFGPMWKAEQRARQNEGSHREGESETAQQDELKALEPRSGIPHRWLNAFLPILTVIGITMLGLFITGYDTAIWERSETSWIAKLSQTIGQSNSYVALLWGSLSGVAVALLLTMGQRLMQLGTAMNSLIDGFKTMLPAVLILVLAWSLAVITKELYTAEFLTSIISDAINPLWLPFITFVLAAFIAFSTGSSWGTMAILYPLILPTTWATCQASGMGNAASMEVMYPVISVVLAGSVLGDHCSPISDTTILSSLATACDHVAHVNTQLPYALTVGGVSAALLLLSLLVGIPWYLNFIIGALVLWGVIYYFGRPVPDFKENTLG
jgi:Na+/H+ antiporter NhaC